MGNKFHGSACKTCRRRGRKCTRELPHCKSCLDKGIECEGYALKWAGIASRGKLAGKTSLAPTEKVLPQRSRSSPKVHQAAATTPMVPLQQTPAPQILAPGSVENLDDSPESSSPFDLDFGQFDQTANFDFDFDTQFPPSIDFTSENTAASRNENGLYDELSEDDDMLFPAQLILPTSMFDPYNVPTELKFILNYHMNEVAPRLCVDNDNVRNPYKQYILPLGLQKPPLLYACAALAASHFSVRLSNQKFHLDCLKFRGKAMRRLQEQLWSEQSAQDEGNITTVLMLTLTDLCLGGPSNFEAHFVAAKKLMDLRGAARTRDNFVEQYIAYLDIMSAASTNRKPVFTSKDIEALTGPSKEWSHDVFPCPPDQFAVISEVVELYKSQQDPIHPTAKVMEQVEKLRARILTRPLHTERGMSWLHLTEAYRHAIVLYIIRLFGYKADEDEISWLTQTVFYHAKQTPPLTGWSDQLLWPLFHAALEIRDERRQKWLRERAQEMQRSGGFGNVETAMKILERVWSTNATPDYMTLLAGDSSTANMIVV